MPSDAGTADAMENTSGPLYKPKESSCEPTFMLRRPKLEVLLPWMAPPPNGGC